MNDFMIELTKEEETVIFGGVRYVLVNVNGIIKLVLLDD